MRYRILDFSWSFEFFEVSRLRFWILLIAYLLKFWALLHTQVFESMAKIQVWKLPTINLCYLVAFLVNNLKCLPQKSDLMIYEYPILATPWLDAWLFCNKFPLLIWLCIRQSLFAEAFLPNCFLKNTLLRKSK